MGQELIRNIQYLQDLQQRPDPSHWFCPRKGAQDGAVFFEEDLLATKGIDMSENAIQARKRPIEEARTRASLALSTMEIFAYSGDDAIGYQRWIRDQLKNEVTLCEICSREYHRGRPELEQKLRENYDDEAVEAFMQKFDDINLERIRTGLEHATTMLRARRPEDRGLNHLDRVGVHALFEALNCHPALADEKFLEQHFDELFGLVQTRKRLKAQVYTPALGYFLFQESRARNSWAKASWPAFKRPGGAYPTTAEFEHAIRPPLSAAMSRVQLQDLDRAFVPRFWAGAKAIVVRLDRNLITHSLRALDLDICKLALDHLQIDCDGFVDLLHTTTHILETSPSDFWEAMGATPANVWVEQFFNSKALQRFVSRAVTPSFFDKELLDSLYAWMQPFFSSIKAVNQPAACRGVLSQLLGTIQSGGHPQQYKDHCFAKGLELISTVLHGVSDKRTGARAAGLEALDVVESHIKQLLSATSIDHQFAEDSSRVIREALLLDCSYLLSDRDALLYGNPLQPGFCAFRSKLWKSTVSSLDQGNLVLAKHLLQVTSSLTAAEPFIFRPDSTQIREQEKFNATYEAINQCALAILERTSEFEAAQIEDLFSQTHTCNALFAHLFSSDIDVRSGLLEVLKAVSGEQVRSAAISAVATSHLAETLAAFSASLNQIASKQIYAVASTLWVGCKDLLEALLNPADGILRSSHDLSSRESGELEKFWAALWFELTTIFGATESWSHQGHSKTRMMDFCRNAMEFADYTFNQFAVLTGALGDGVESSAATRNAGKRLVADPKAAMDVAGKWLRLRDPFLLEKSTELICKLLERLKQFDTAISESALSYIKDIYTGVVRNNLTQTEKAELRRAWERHTGRSMHPEAARDPSKQKTMQTIDLEQWRSKAQLAASKPIVHGQQRLDQIIASSTRGLDSFKAQQAHRPTKAIPTGLSKAPPKARDSADFMKKREAEMAAMKKQKLEAIALAKRRANAAHTADEGSGLAGLGVYDIDHSAPKGEGVMVSSDEESEESDNDMDNELFGMPTKTKTKQLDPEAQKNAEALRQANLRRKPQGPVKKQRVNRNARDMRARLAPDLSELHQSILTWDYFHEGPFPPNSSARDYATVLDSFRDPVDYQRTFQPLLLLEAWNGFLKAKEEITARPFDIKVLNRSSVDAFVEVSTSIAHPDAREISEGDIVLMSKADNPISDPKSPHAIARVHRMSRKKAHVEALVRLLPRTTLAPALTPNTSLRCIKVTSITPLEREYGALLGLQYYDLCDEIAKARPSPLLEYSDESLQRLISNYRVNKAQAKAIKSAIDNDAFTLVQGPPGSGKTKTIVAIVGALLSESLRTASTTPNLQRAPGQADPSAGQTTKKLLVCAPSNAAVDELVLRFKQGVRTMSGEDRELKVLRLGKSDAISSSVLDVTLDELVNKRLNPTDTQGLRDETQKIMKQHQDISARLRDARSELDQAEARKASTGELTRLRKEVDELRKSKTLLSTKIDSAKDNEGSQSRLAEQRKRQVQQDIIGEAHVICATLSGSGHDMFQNINVEFETVVIDEAAQCVELSALIPLKYGCAKCVLVGDPQQLPPTVFSKDAARFKYEQSLFVRMQKNHPADVHLLDTQYRMHPAISEFPSKTFYDGRLLDGPDMASLRKQVWHAAELLGPFRFFDVQGQHQAAPKGHSLVNHAEVRVAMQLYQRLRTDFAGVDFDGKIGVITPYKSQLRELKDQFRRRFGDGITDRMEFNTTDAFQGRESDIIIFSCVRASPAGGVGFLQDIRRMNVGLTRAKSSLWVLGNSGSLLRGEYWAKLIEHAKATRHFTDGDIERLFQQKLSISADIEMPDAPEEPGRAMQKPSVPVKRKHSTDSVVERPQPPPPPPNPAVRQTPTTAPVPVRGSINPTSRTVPPTSNGRPEPIKTIPKNGSLASPTTDATNKKDTSLTSPTTPVAPTNPSQPGRKLSISSSSASKPALLRKKDVNIFMPKKKRYPGP